MTSYNTLSPSGDSRVRGSSHMDFKTATTGISAKAMRNDISHLVGTVEDPATKRVRIGLLLPL
jgi:UTP--glucose-1-phosphate uridylyltransferase